MTARDALQTASSSAAEAPNKLSLAHLPTPLWRNAALDRLLGLELWVKRDDMTGGAEAGNKIRKLEYLLADARRQGCNRVITCGAVQSNHARATAVLCRQLGMQALLLLRHTPQDRVTAAPVVVGNLLLDRLVGADIRYVSIDEYARRGQLMTDEAKRLLALGEHPYIIPEGGSNGLGALGYVDSVGELQSQVARGQCPAQFDSVVAACGSGGTAAGLALGLAGTPLAPRVDAICVCDDAAHFRQATARMIEQARALRPSLGSAVPLHFHDAYVGPGYGIMSPEQREFLVRVARCSGLVLDPVYSGKALYGLSQLREKPRRVLFIHTGGLPGLLAEANQPWALD
jgi:D-cysteine desulfhydrase